MNDSSAYGQLEDGAAPAGPWPGQQPPMPMPPNPAGQYKFSSEEMRVLQECNRESFFQRSMPFGTVLGLGTLTAVQRGYLKPNPRFGAFPKVTMAVIMGYFLGKLSYQQACAEKLMALPNSYIGQLLRDKRDERMGRRPPVASSKGPMFGATSSDIYSDAGPGSSLDLDTDRPIFNDDTYRPDQASGPTIVDIPPPGPQLSYEELRRKNRNEFTDTKQDPYRVEPRPARPMPPSPPRAPASTNKYGDVME